MTLANTNKQSTNPQSPIYLKDYTVPDFLMDSVHLHFDLMEDVTTVKAILAMRRNPKSTQASAVLRLHGEALELRRVALDGRELSETEYTVDDNFLTIPNVPEHFQVETQVNISPHLNFQLSGLYQSRGNYCTQCEPHGFRRITYFLDRPDVMTRFTTAISADKSRYPVLLSNGNLVDAADLPGNRHWVLWQDPSLKPCYLFALVAGDYEQMEDTFTTLQQRKVRLLLYVEKGQLSQASYAMQALKKSMRWDEEEYGCEYDLEMYMIVAVSDFNMGAMENKGLNIFNTKYVLAEPQTATDEDYIGIERVIGHEYFHNWTGNRITCRDWFQITLKEGLTVFREQRFVEDMTSQALARIKSVEAIRTIQFAEDAGPMAHPIRPASYIEINNFYTSTVYNKGSEVIRMIETLLGRKTFRKGMDLYFERHDGQAVTTDDFVQAMMDVSGRDLSQFKRWYAQAGTPVLTVKDEYDPTTRRYCLMVQQSCPATPDQPEKQPFHFPLAIGLLDEKGQPLTFAAENQKVSAKTHILEVKAAQERFIFENIAVRPTPSLLRNFSAPVRLDYHYTDHQLLQLAMYDEDPVSRWDAALRYGAQLILKLAHQHRAQASLQLPPEYVHAISTILSDSLDKNVVAELLRLPSEKYLHQLQQPIEVASLHAARNFVRHQLGVQLQERWLAVYRQNYRADGYRHSMLEVGQRSVANLALDYLVRSGVDAHAALAVAQYEDSEHMTHRMGALLALNDHPQYREVVMEDFFTRFQKEALVLDKWFSLQATADVPDATACVQALLQHPSYEPKNPNRVRSLLAAFSANFVHFHAPSGAGYRLLVEQILQIDTFNGQLAARLISPLLSWKTYALELQPLMRAELERVLQMKPLSNDVYELVSKSVETASGLR